MIHFRWGIVWGVLQKNCFVQMFNSFCIMIIEQLCPHNAFWLSALNTLRKHGYNTIQLIWFHLHQEVRGKDGLQKDQILKLAKENSGCATWSLCATTWSAHSKRLKRPRKCIWFISRDGRWRCKHPRLGNAWLFCTHLEAVLGGDRRDLIAT